MKDSIIALEKATGLTLAYSEGKLSGEMGATYKTEVGLEIPLRFVVDSWFQEGCLGVLAKSDTIFYASLGFMACIYSKSNIVSLYLLDLSSSDLHVKKNMSLREAVKTVRPAIIASYYWKEGRWNILTLPE